MLILDYRNRTKSKQRICQNKIKYVAAVTAAAAAAAPAPPPPTPTTTIKLCP